MLKLVQRTGQAAFLAAERVFNRVFGDALNPFYYLGAIAYFLLWVVVAAASTSTSSSRPASSEAYDSVEYLTHEQWWLGGILRSFHRYASDAMVLAMVLHLVRHFVFDHYRSFRWFSWVSGVILLWLVYISGINGYMLPWDRTAQFVTVATAEWLDWLPVFNGALIRNFITPDAVNDRLFSLLSFLHIGLPLGVLATAVDPHAARARREDARRRARSGSASRWRCSCCRSSSRRCPARPPTSRRRRRRFRFDWFYLTVYPLIYRGRRARCGRLVGGLTLLLLVRCRGCRRSARRRTIST